MVLPLSDARKNDELVSLADSQMLRWMDELNNVIDADEKAQAVKTEIRSLRKEPNSLKNRRAIKRLYAELDELQFKPDYVCVIMDREKDYQRARRGFSINGLSYHRLLGTNGGVKNETIVFVADRHRDELNRRIDNNRSPDKKLVAAKLEAYKALTCSASLPVSMPHGILIVDDCNTRFITDIVYLNDENDGEPVMEDRHGVPVDLDESDGYGMMLPSLAERWGNEIGLDYRPSGVNTRFSWEKGMVFCFDFQEFARDVAGGYIVKDAWGTERDIRDVELVLTTSMVKLWDSYKSCEDYINSSLSNHYTFGIAKVCPRTLESVRNLNYQFIQSYELDDSDIEELVAPTIKEINDILHADYRKTVLFLKGMGMKDSNVGNLSYDYSSALMIEPELINDPYVQSRIYQAIKNRINEAKVGVIQVHGNYSIVCGDPYSLCQSMFGLEVTGLLKAGQIYNGYWADTGANQLVCFRAPMTCHNNIRKVTVNDSPETRHWYQYMTTCTLFNSWDTAAHALNGMDKDGDLVMLTDNSVLLRNHRDLPALMCIQRKAAKKIVTEDDIVQANINSFGDEIGKTTNRITAMFEVQSRYPKDSIEYKTLDYRIKCGQLFQQNAIDKAKGIIAKPMPREWFDGHHAAEIGDPDLRALYLRILAEKKPYFMRYIYPDLMKQYNTYVKNTDKKSLREFSMTVDELYALPAEKLTDEQLSFLKYFERYMPVGTGDCVSNKICKRFESEFDGYIGKRASEYEFDYNILKSGCEYTRGQFNSIEKLFEEYNNRIRDYNVFASRERVDSDEASANIYMIGTEFRAACDSVCSNAKILCDIMLDICYQRSSTKGFVWNMCGREIVDNLLARHGYKFEYPTLNPDGEIEFGGYRFSYCEKQLEVSTKNDSAE